MLKQVSLSPKAPDKTRALAQVLREAIAEGGLPAGAALPSERELMEQYGLSRTTVRRAVQLLVDGGEVVRKAGSGSFVADGLPAPTLSVGSPTISLIIPTFSNPLYSEMADSIERLARQGDLRLMTSQSDYSADSESAQLEALAGDPAILGAIVVPSTVERPSRGAMRFVSANKPLVYMGRWPGGIAADGATADYAAAGTMAVEHLIELGHRRIVYVEGAPHLAGFSLLQGYEAAMRQAQLPTPAELVRILDLPSEAAGFRAVEDLLAQGVEFSAVFTRNDVTAVGVMKALRKARRRIPEDVAVASVDNSMIARSMTPLLTSVNIFPEALGKLAFRLLNDRLEGSYDGPPAHVSITPSLVVRASTTGEGNTPNT